jgi:hypothetical protein
LPHKQARASGAARITLLVRCECLRLNRRDVRSHAGADARPGNASRAIEAEWVHLRSLNHFTLLNPPQAYEGSKRGSALDSLIPPGDDG